MNTPKFLNGLIALAGVWEVIATFVLGYAVSTAALWNAIIVGVALIVLGVGAALANQATTDKTLDWVTVGVGIWLIIAPFLLGYTTVPMAFANDIIVGLIVVALAGSAEFAMSRQQPLAK